MTQYFVCPVSHATVVSTGSGQEPPLDSDGVTRCVEVTEEEYNQQVADNDAVVAAATAKRVAEAASEKLAAEEALIELLQGSGVTDPSKQELLLKLFRGR